MPFPISDSDLGPTSCCFWDTATCSLNFPLKIAAKPLQMETFDSVWEVTSALSDGTIADPLRLTI